MAAEYDPIFNTENPELINLPSLQQYFDSFFENNCSNEILSPEPKPISDVYIL
jgi:hypothetical protein